MACDITFSVLTWNSADTVIQCIESIRKFSSGVSLQVVVVDNASSDNTVALLRLHLPEVTVIANPVNRYFSAHNQALGVAEGRYCAIINPDIVLGASTIGDILAYLDANPDVVAVAPHHRLPDGAGEPVAKRRLTPMHCLWMYTLLQLVAPWYRRRFYHSLADPFRIAETTHLPVEVDVLQGSCIFVRTETLRAVGGFDSAFRLYFVDDDLSLRLHHHGKVMYHPGIEIVHFQSTSISKMPPARLRWIRYADMLTYLRKYFGLAVCMAFMPLTWMSMVAWAVAQAFGFVERGLSGVMMGEALPFVLATKEMTVSVLTYNSADTVAQCLASIRDSLAGISSEIYLVDNASRDATLTVVRNGFPDVAVIANGVNEYFIAHNRVISCATGRYTMITNPDICISASALKKMLSFMNTHPEIVAVAPLHRLSDGSSEKIAKRRIRPSDCLWVFSVFQLLAPGLRASHYRSINVPSDHTTGVIYADVVQDSCILVRTEALRMVGGYDARLKLYFTEDDLCLKLAHFGKVVYWPEVEILHAQSTSIRKEPPFKIRKIRYIDMLIYLRIYYGIIAYLFFYPITWLSIAVWYMVHKNGVARHTRSLQ
jgi:N-acetylglucosaminyl-diphospho-decaprenol L-rhamnosyltransferase